MKVVPLWNGKAIARWLLSLLLMAAMICTAYAQQPLTARSVIASQDNLKQTVEVKNFRIGGTYDLANPKLWENGAEGGKTLESLGAAPARTSYIAVGTPRRDGKGEIINAILVNSYYSGDATTMYNNWYIGQAGNGFSGGAQQYGIYVDAGVVAGMTAITGNVSIGNVTGDVFGGGWRTYTPTLASITGAFTDAAKAGRYRVIDKTVQFQVTVNIITNGTAAGGVIVGLPVPSSLVSGTWFAVNGRASQISGKALAGSIQPTLNTVSMFNYDGSYPGVNGELLVISGTYEAA